MAGLIPSSCQMGVEVKLVWLGNGWEICMICAPLTNFGSAQNREDLALLSEVDVAYCLHAPLA